MKTSLSHLPQTKQEQILQIVEIIKEVAAPEKIILFGSYATGNWVEDKYIERGIKYEYKSDYDFLVVTKNNSEKEYVLQDKIINRCRSRYQTPVTPIIHDIDYVNEGLEIGQYFFTDIVEEGIILYDSNIVKFAKARELSKEEMKEIAERYFSQWFRTATNFLNYSNYAFEKSLKENEPLNDAAFLLHQATERFYNTVLLVFTSYKPKTHNLDKLRHYVKPLSIELFSLFPFPIEDKQENHLFDLLMRGYIDARYKDDYMITKEEFNILLNRLQRMQEIVGRICKDKIASFD